MNENLRNYYSKIQQHFTKEGYPRRFSSRISVNSFFNGTLFIVIKLK